MKTMKQADLDRLGKKKGFKVKRKMGVQPKKPEPEVEDEVALSGARAIEAEIPAPALPVAPVESEAFASMSASMAASNANVEKLIANNTATIEAFRAQLAEQAGQVKGHVPWRHKIKRTEKLLIDEVISTPMGNA